MSFFTDPSANRSSTVSNSRFGSRQDFAPDNRARDRFADSLEQASARTSPREERTEAPAKDTQKPDRADDAQKDKKPGDKAELRHQGEGKVAAREGRDEGGQAGQQSDQQDDGEHANAAIMLQAQSTPVVTAAASGAAGSSGFVDMRQLEQVDRMAAAIAELHQATGAEAQLTVSFGAAIPLAEGAVVARHQTTGEVSIQIVGLHPGINTGESAKLAQSLRRQLELREVRIAHIDMGDAPRQQLTGKAARKGAAS